MKNNEIKTCIATPEELPAIINIEQTTQAFPWTETMLRDCLNENYHFWVLKKSATIIIGFIIFQIYANEGHIHNLVINQDQQQQGYGSLLLQQTLDFMSQNKAKKIFLEVRRSNQNALKLYKRFGFKEIGVRKNYYPAATSGREDAIVLTINNKPS
jgi:[ribosomal protein S18]-alanine N-acetyltransferase